MTNAISSTKRCPRCGRLGVMYQDEGMNALSRYADVYICGDCGNDEAFRDFQHREPKYFDTWYRPPTSAQKKSLATSLANIINDDVIDMLNEDTLPLAKAVAKALKAFGEKHKVGNFYAVNYGDEVTEILKKKLFTLKSHKRKPVAKKATKKSCRR